jgi:hypothetical protein
LELRKQKMLLKNGFQNKGERMEGRYLKQITKDAFEKISAVLNIARYEGNNATTQQEATDAITEVIKQLDNISIIANS